MAATSVPCPSAPLHSPHFFRLDVDLDLHAGITVPGDAADEIPGPDGGKRNNIVAGRESRYGVKPFQESYPALLTSTTLCTAAEYWNLSSSPVVNLILETH